MDCWNFVVSSKAGTDGGWWWKQRRLSWSKLEIRIQMSILKGFKQCYHIMNLCSSHCMLILSLRTDYLEIIFKSIVTKLEFDPQRIIPSQHFKLDGLIHSLHNSMIAMNAFPCVTRSFRTINEISAWQPVIIGGQQWPTNHITFRAKIRWPAALLSLLAQPATPPCKAAHSTSMAYWQSVHVWPKFIIRR